MSNTNPVWLSDHHTPRRSDPTLVVLQKTLGAIIDGGGSSPSTSAVSQGHGPPNSPPADPTNAAIYTDLDSGTIYSWSVPGQNWF